MHQAHLAAQHAVEAPVREQRQGVFVQAEPINHRPVEQLVQQEAVHQPGPGQTTPQVSLPSSVSTS